MENNEQHPLLTYAKAEGKMHRKEFIILNIILFVLTILTQIAFIQKMQAAGVDITSPDQIKIPVWGAFVIILTNIAIIPAFIMRARDANWPPALFAGLFSLHIAAMTLHSLFEITLPSAVAFVLQGLMLVSVVALMIRPSSN